MVILHNYLVNGIEPNIIIPEYIYLTLFQLLITNKQNKNKTKKKNKKKAKTKTKAKTKKAKHTSFNFYWINFILSITSLRLSIYKTNQMLANKDIDLKRLLFTYTLQKYTVYHVYQY